MAEPRHNPRARTFQTKLKKLERAELELAMLKKSSHSMVVEERRDPRLAFIGYESWFLRAPKPIKSTNYEKQVVSLAKQVFHKYPTRGPLVKVWLTEERQLDNLIEGADGHDLKLWHIAAGRGESVYKSYAKGILTKAEVHALLTCPFNLSLPQGLIFAKAIGQGAPLARALLLAQTKLQRSVIRPGTEVTLRFFSRVTDLLYKDKVDDLLDYITATDQDLSGLTFASLCKRSETWHRGQFKLRGATRTWEGHPLNNVEYTDQIIEHGKLVDRKWNFVQLLSERELVTEGNAQHHCVAGYSQQCVRGERSIWSLLCNDKRSATIELTNTGQIVQARRYANASLLKGERQILGRWAVDNHLTVSC